jgi:hypothetical protein
MSINIELALVLGLFVIGAVVLAMDDQVDALRRRLNRSFLRRRLISAEGQALRHERKKPPDRSRLSKRDLTDGF